MHQADLFPLAPRRRREEVIFERAFSQEVQDAIMVIYQSRPGEWLEWEDHRTVIDKFEIGHCLGHVLHRMAANGQIKSKNVYFGSKEIGPEYLGFKTDYMFEP